LVNRNDETLRAIKEGFGRLTSLGLIRCYGDVLSFVDLVDIPNLEEFRYESNEDEQDAVNSEDIIMAAAKKYPNLTSIG
jgi:hypothetical protein